MFAFLNAERGTIHVEVFFFFNSSTCTGRGSGVCIFLNAESSTRRGGVCNF